VISNKDYSVFFTYKIGSVKGSDLFLYIQIYIMIGISKKPLCFRSNIEYNLYQSTNTGITVHRQFIFSLTSEKDPGEDASSPPYKEDSLKFSFADTV